jgi:PAS domain S-box-containing protein
MAKPTGQELERLIAELKALRESEERWRSILKNAPGVIVAAEPDGTVTFVNRTLSGIPPEQVVGTSVFDHVLPEDRQRVRDALEEVLSTGETVTYEVVASARGVAVPVESRVGPLERDGRVTGVTIVSSDVSERKRAEEERRKLEVAMENAQRLESLGLLAGGIAHDFNNLLVVILGNADLALMDLEPHARHREWIEQIRLAAKRASELTNQMLVYSGLGTHVAEPLDLNLLVAEMGNLLGASMSKKVALNRECDGEVPLVYADASQMRQVVMNLVTNASEAIGDQHGTVTIRVGAVQLGQEASSRMLVGEDLPEGRYVGLEVADTGTGIAEGARSKLFDPFYTTKFAGRGLGLAAVLGIVRAHRGAIEVGSRVGEGSTFRMLLPVAEVGAAASSEDRGSRDRDSRGSGKILIVDDEEGVRDVAKGMLEREGFSVITAEDGSEAVRIFPSISPEIDAVLLDLSMPQMDGGQVLQEMRRIRPDVKVILCSGYMEGRVRELSDGPGQASFLHKPFDSETLLRTLREVLASGPQRDRDDQSEKR